MKLDVISTKELDLSDYGMNGTLRFKAIVPRQVTKYQKKFEKLEKEGKEGEAMELMEEIVKDYFVGGEVKKGKKKEKVDELGDIDMSILWDCFELIAGSSDLEKKVKSIDT